MGQAITEIRFSGYPFDPGGASRATSIFDLLDFGFGVI